MSSSRSDGARLRVSRAVLDASAVLALLNDEPGAERVAPHVAEGVISTVNSAEVIGKLMEEGMPEEVAVEALDILALEAIDFDRGLAVRTGALRALTRRIGLSLGDRACLATAERLVIPAVTADRRWAEVPLAMTIQQVR